MLNHMLQVPNNGTHLYNPILLEGLDWNSFRHSLSPFITNTEPGESWLVIRPLQIEDYDKGFLNLLSQLTTVGNISRSIFERKLHLGLVSI